MKARNDKLNEAIMLLNGEEQPRAPKTWVIRQNSPDSWPVGYPDEVQPQDLVIRIIRTIIGSKAKPEVKAPKSKKTDVMTPEAAEEISKLYQA